MLRRLLMPVCAAGAFLAVGTPLGALPAQNEPSALTRGYNGFGFHLLAELRSNEQNVFISPASVAMALGIVTNGAAGPTRAQLLAALGLAGSSTEAFDSQNGQLMASLRDAGSDMQFSVANALWANPDYPLRPEFVQTSSAVFNATAQNLPFGDPSAAATINAWVKEHTFGLIPEILDATSKRDALIVTNAIAMKAKWLAQFDKNSTHDAPFTLNDGHKVTVSMMQHEGMYGYARQTDWQVARLPYLGDRFAMYVFLPREGLTLASALATFDAKAFDTAIGALKEQHISFAMPRFSAEYKTELNAPLGKLGVVNAFDPMYADFSGMLEGHKAYISQVLHRTFVRVDEEGTEAAAVTAIVMKTLAIPMPPADHMVVDRPFLMAIRDDRSRQILFLGTIVAPENAKKD